MDIIVDDNDTDGCLCILNRENDELRGLQKTLCLDSARCVELEAIGNTSSTRSSSIPTEESEQATVLHHLCHFCMSFKAHIAKHQSLTTAHHHERRTYCVSLTDLFASGSHSTLRTLYCTKSANGPANNSQVSRRSPVARGDMESRPGGPIIYGQWYPNRQTHSISCQLRFPLDPSLEINVYQVQT